SGESALSYKRLHISGSPLAPKRESLFRGMPVEPLERRILLAASMVKDNAGNMSSSPSQIVDLNGTAIFVSSASTGYSLWKSAGTETGTVLLKEFGGNSYDSPLNLTV